MNAINDDYLKSLGGQRGTFAQSASGADEASADGADAGVATVFALGSTWETPSSFMDAVSSAENGRVVVLCAEPGMGATALLARALEMRAASGDSVRHEDFVLLDVRETLASLGELVTWCRQCLDARESFSVALDNLPAGDESDMDRIVRLIRQIAGFGACVFVSILPECEQLVEQLGESWCFWSCNLRLRRPGTTEEAVVYDALTQGVPSLVEAASRAGGRDIARIMGDPGYLQAYASVMASSFRPAMMSEERKLRSVLALFGHGGFLEVEEAMGRVDVDLWRTLARDAPVFGVDALRETFRCAGAEGPDGLAPVATLLAEQLGPWPELVAAVVRHLVGRGEARRAATVSMLCSSEFLRCQLLLEWSVEFVDAGEVDAVRDACRSARQDGLRIAGLREAECLMDALDSPLSTQPRAETVDAQTRQGRVAELATRCRGLLAGTVPLDDELPAGSTTTDDAAHDEALRGMWACEEALRLMLVGHLEAAFALLIDAPVRRAGDTLTSAILQMEFVACSLLGGIVPTRADYDALDRARALLEHANLLALVGVCEALVPLGMLLAGRRVPAHTFETSVQRASRMGDKLLHGVFLVAAAVLDMRNHAYVRAHVRMGQACTDFAASRATYLGKVARLLDTCVRLVLAERVPRADINMCKGADHALDKAVAVVLGATSQKRGRRPVGSGHWDMRTFPRDVHWLMNVLTGDFGSLSHKMRDVMPGLWYESVERAATEIDALADPTGKLAVASAHSPTPTMREERIVAREEATGSEQGTRRVSVNALGGLEVRVDGVAVGNNALERRRAKSMLALLAAVPGHAAKRFTIMESVWPEYDYATAHRCVYAATSVLRREVCGNAHDLGGCDVVVSNRSDRTILLNMALVSCDVDAFESKAHEALDSQGDDRRVVALCRDIEDIYRGRLFVPPTDGVGIVSSRSQELQELYSDAMVAGADAALRVQLKMLACRFAKKAHEADDMREDAIKVLLVALCAAGRRVEAEQAYEQYVSHVIDVTRRPPSRGLRKVASELLSRKRRETVGHAAAPEVRDAPEQLQLDLGDMGDLAPAGA